MTFAHGATLVGVLASVGTRTHQRGDLNAAFFLSVVPEVVVGPTGGGSSVQNNCRSSQHRLLRNVLCYSIDRDCWGQGVGITYSDGKCLLAYLAIGRGVSHAVNVAMVGLDRYLSSGFACAPLPITAIFSTFWKLRDEHDVAAVGRNTLRGAYLILIAYASQVGLVLERFTFIDNVAVQWCDGLLGRYRGSPAGQRRESKSVEAS